jgi:IclR family acetate operon transcriptional repressor
LAILAQLPDDEVDRVLSSPIEKLTPQTDTDPESIRKKIDEIRRVGYAVSINQNRMGVCAVGAAVLGEDGCPVGGIGISMPETRFDEQRVSWWGKQVSDTAANVSSLL